jgi:hypothetical protein
MLIPGKSTRKNIFKKKLRMLLEFIIVLYIEEKNLPKNEINIFWIR